MRLGPTVRLSLVLLAAGLTTALAFVAPGVIAGRALAVSVPWVPAAGLELALRLDALSLLFALIVCGVGTLVAVYAASYLEGGPSEVRRFYLYLTVFLLSMLGVVVADDLLLLYVCWELTTLSSFFLIGFDHDRREARDAARHALLVTVAGGLALLAGVIALSIAGGTTRISELATRGDAIRAHPMYHPALIAIALAALTKSAQVPFHSWLPRAMEAPMPASAYLHAATMVKAGIYLLARFSPMLAGTAEWSVLFTMAGALTMLVGAVRALGETHVKPMLAYTTIAALGLIVMLLGISTPYAIAAAMIYVLAHALYKGALFLFAGALLHGAGAKDAEKTRGLARAMPRTSIAAVLAAASMAGVPATLGFLGKDLTYAATWPVRSDDAVGWAVLGASFVASALFVAVALVAGVRPLFGPRGEPGGAEETPAAHDPSLAL
nr:hypothetical protein [Myxococcota bacterium]